MIISIIAGSNDVCLKNIDLSYVIAVDKGYSHAKKNQITPNLVIGDFDSLEDIELEKIDQKIIKLNPTKDETDLLVAIKEALKMNPDKICIYGATNNRFDHYLANVHMLNLGNIELIDSINRIYLKDCSFEIEKKEEYVSFFNYSGEPVITLAGFKYNLNDYNLKYSDTLCVSNEVLTTGAIKVEKGKILVIHCNK